MINSLRMRIFFLLVVLSCALSTASYGQLASHNIADSLREAFKNPPSAVARLETRNAFVTGRPVRTYGIKGGVSFGKRVAVGVGYHWLRHGDSYLFRLPGGMEEVRELRMQYLAGFFEYSFIASRNWEVTIPFVFGVGSSREFIQEEGPRASFNRAPIVLYEPGIVAEYHFLRYFAAGAGVGMRLMLRRNPNIDQQFTAPIWELRFRVKLGRIWDDVEPLFLDE